MIPNLARIGTAIMCLLTVAAAEAAQKPTALIRYDSTWRYLEPKTFLQPDWVRPDYDDGSWPTGRGAFVAPRTEAVRWASIGTLLHEGNRLPRGQHVHYFRTRFQWSSESAGRRLVSSNLVDDGAIFYLNGHEVGRLGMPEGSEGFRPLHRSEDVSAKGVEVLELSPEHLVEGTNVVAVSLHQGGPLSSDAVFAMELWAHAEPEGEPVFKDQPRGQFVFEGDEVELQAQVVGTRPIGFHWLKDGEPWATTVRPTLDLGFITRNHAGHYQLMASNRLGVTASDRTLIAVASPGLVPFHQEWRYRVHEREVGADWNQPSFDDSGWAMGIAPIGARFSAGHALPDKPYRTLVRKSWGPNEDFLPPVHLFRTAFIWPYSPQKTALEFIAMMDDAAVIHLNGKEVFRLGMIPGPVNHLTRANRHVEDPVLETNTVANCSLLAGTNHVAVSLHQSGVDSGDISFALRIGHPMHPPSELRGAIIEGETEVVEGQTARLHLAFEGGPASIRWYEDGSLLPGERGPSLLFPSVSLGQEGLYQAKLSNEVSQTESPSIMLRVAPDREGPVVQEVDGALDPETVLVHYNEPVFDGTNLLHYEIRSREGGVISLLSAVAKKPDVIQLTSAPRDQNFAYELVVAGVRDRSDARNAMETPVSVLIGRRITLADAASAWEFVPSNRRWRSQWLSPDAPIPWQKSPEVLASFKSSPLYAKHAIRYRLPASSDHLWLRVPFFVPMEGKPSRLKLRHLVDDGALFYLEGVEVHRFNIPRGPAQKSRYARAPVRTPSWSPWHRLSVEHLHSGTNWLMVEVRRARLGDRDIQFASEMILHFDGLPQASQHADEATQGVPQN